MSQKSAAQSLSSGLKSAVRYPLYAVQVFTGAKSFRDNPILGSTVLNRLGLHVFRLVAAAGIAKFRYFSLSGLMSKEERQSYNENGYLLIAVSYTHLTLPTILLV